MTEVVAKILGTDVELGNSLITPERLGVALTKQLKNYRARLRAIRDETH